MKYLKKPKKDTDMCHICESGKKNEKRLATLKNKKDLSEKEKTLLKKYKLIEELFVEHIKIVEHQKDFFNNEIKTITSIKKVVLVMDFKQNIVINQSHNVEIGRDWYQSPQRTVFGVTAYYLEDNIIKKKYFDIFSNSSICHIIHTL